MSAPQSGSAPNPGDGHGPIIPLPPAGPPLAVLLAACLVLGVGLFALLEGRRHEVAGLRPEPPASAQPAPPPPALVIPPAPPPAPPLPPPKPQVQIVYRPGPSPPPIVQYIERPTAAPPPQPFQPARLQEPALVIDLTEAAAVANGDAVHAQVMHHRSMTIPQGTIIPAVLETPINSSTPGLTRAIISKDIRGFDGARVLIPKGSRLFGEYQSDVRAGQSRAVVNWTNLVRPDGVSIRLASPASDANGRTGIPGHVNNHILARLASAVLQSSLEFGENYAYRSASAGSVIVSAPIQTVASASTPLIPSAQAGPTISVQQGADIAVLVAHDLDFTGTPFRQ